MPVTVIVEPDNGGHRFQAVANVANLARRYSDVVLVTSRGATRTDEFAAYLCDVDITVDERFDRIHPPTRQLARAIADYAREHEVDTALVMDADQSLKRWWYVAPLEFRGLVRKPRVAFMLTRYPAKLRLTDWFGWKLRLSKGLLAVLAICTGSLHRLAGFAGREDMTVGWLVKRARDPAICSASSRDRARIRAELGLPADRTLVGIFGGMTARKNPALVLEAILDAGLEADLLLAGLVKPDVAEWLDRLPADLRPRVIVRDGFLANEVLDKLVAAADVVALAMTLNGPSGIMGKALAADVPVVTAGSEVRARELRATGGGEEAELRAASFGAALRKVLTQDPTTRRPSTVPPATADGFAAVLLGVPVPTSAAPPTSPLEAAPR